MTHTSLYVVISQSQQHKARYWELQQECLGRQKHLSGLNDDVRQDLLNLEKKVEQLQAPEPGAEESAPSNDAAVDIVVTTVECDSNDGGGEATIREELRALKTKVDIIAANVLGEAEGNGNDDGSDDLTADAKTAEDTANTGVEENNTESRSQTDDEGEATADTVNLQQEHERAASSAQRVKARNNWTKVRMNRAFLVKKIRRQVCA